MNQEQETKHWPGDDTPDHEAPAEVRELANIDAQLGALGLRGLASANGRDIKHAYSRLTAQLRANYLRGRHVGTVVGLLAGSVLGAVAGSFLGSI